MWSLYGKCKCFVVASGEREGERESERGKGRIEYYNDLFSISLSSSRNAIHARTISWTTFR